MQLLMVLLLALIALALVPGLIWVFAAGAIAYGAVIAIGAIFTFILMAGCLLWPSVKSWKSKRNTAAKIKEANRIFREKEEIKIAAHGVSSATADIDDSGTDGVRKSCRKCQMEMFASSSRCPSCGHKVIPQEP